MKKIVFFILIGFSLITFNKCTPVNPIIADVCEITLDICKYAEILCDTFDPKTLTKSELDQLKKELMEIKNTLENKANEMKIRADLKKNEKDKYFYLVDRMKSLTKEIDEALKRNSEIVSE